MPGVLDTSKKVDGKPVLRSHSFSGNESNSVFLNLGGRSFENISGISGLDSLADGRAFAFFDYDHDGRQDLVLTNTNNPQLQLFHNRIAKAGNSIHVRLTGGAKIGGASEGWSNRDAYGSHVIVKAGGMTLRRELRCGDGFAAQNSKTLSIGIGQEMEAEVTVLWPSGRKTELGKVKEGKVISVFENPDNGTQSVADWEEVEIPTTRLSAAMKGRLDLPLEEDLNVVVTMATWCPICRDELEHLRRLKADGGGVAFIGLPIDPEDSAEKIKAFEFEAKPPYKIALLDPEIRKNAEDLMKKAFGENPLPATFILDRAGNVLEAMKGTPSLSQLRLIRSTR
jgi:thiol-disulfide isomerase/thioredoxin